MSTHDTISFRDPAQLEMLLTGNRASRAIVISSDGWGLNALLSTLGAAGQRLNLGLISIIGPDAEAAHDAIDDALEVAGMDDVITSFHELGNGAETAAFISSCSESQGVTTILVEGGNAGLAQLATKLNRGD